MRELGSMARESLGLSFLLGKKLLNGFSSLNMLLSCATRTLYSRPSWPFVTWTEGKHLSIKTAVVVPLVSPTRLPQGNCHCSAYASSLELLELHTLERPATQCLLHQALELLQVAAEHLRRLAVERVIRVGLVEEVDEAVDDRVDVEDGLPVRPQDVQAHVALQTGQTDTTAWFISNTYDTTGKRNSTCTCTGGPHVTHVA